MKLNVGCNKHGLEGFINADVVLYDAVDVVCDASHLPFKDGCMDDIYAGHLLEHLPSPFQFFLECRRLLCAEGKFTVVVPDLTSAAEERNIVVGILYGFWLNEDDTPTDEVPTAMHRTWWTPALLRAFGGHMGLEFVDWVDPWLDSHLVIGADWHRGCVFKRSDIDPSVLIGLGHYRRILL